MLDAKDSRTTSIISEAELSAFPEPIKNHAEKDPFAVNEDQSDQVNFRTLGWMRASVFFTKMTFGIGVLSIPSSFYNLGLVAGIIFVLFWGALNTYMAYLMGQFKLKHPSFHTLPDGVRIMAKQWGASDLVANLCMWTVEALYLLTWILASGVTMLGFTIALNAVSTHATCTVVFAVVSYIVITTVASIRKISHLAWFTWVGFFSVVIAVMIVVIAVTIPDRPHSAPQTGPFELGFSALPAAKTTFTTAFSASLAIFSSSGNTPGYIPVIAEMKRPQDYNKALFVCMGWITAAYLAFSTVMFYYCGAYVASPALGSAGPTIKIIAYAIAIPGLIAGGATLTHIAAKGLFVRFLRNSRHLTRDTKTHWIVWLSCTFGVGGIAFILAEAIPFFGQLISLIGSLCFGPISIIAPAFMWFSLNPGSLSEGGIKKKLGFLLHAVFVLIGLFVTVAGTYAVIVDIVDAYSSGTVGGAFECADNSGSV